MATVIHLLWIIDDNFIILDHGLKYYKTSIEYLKYVPWTLSKASSRHYLPKYKINKYFYAVLQPIINNNELL